ncbi:MAG: hypothetical protein ACI3V3_06695 [Faecousia sp.]
MNMDHYENPGFALGRDYILDQRHESAEPSQVMTGRKFGRWMVLRDSLLTSNGERKWLCRCECGTMRYVLERSLRYGGSRSCGCVRKENARQAVALDLEGMTFGSLTVIARAPNRRKNGGIRWLCRCDCGNSYEVPGTLLVTGRRTHCGSKAHGKNHFTADITGQKFNLLTALYPTSARSPRGSVIWHCRCDCGNEIDIAYNDLVYCNIKSCGCQKKAHDENLKNLLTHVNGTSLDMIRSKKLPSDNTTGHKGVYLIKGRFMAKIVFQKKAYYLGTYERIEDAVKAREQAEALLFDGTAAFYEKWKQRADQDPEWAEDNPVEIHVYRTPEGALSVSYTPSL